MYHKGSVQVVFWRPKGLWFGHPGSLRVCFMPKRFWQTRRQRTHPTHQGHHFQPKLHNSLVILYNLYDMTHHKSYDVIEKGLHLKNSTRLYPVGPLWDNPE